MQTTELLEYTLPDYLASYLVNGDSSSLTDNEIKEIDAFLEKEGVAVLEMKEDSSFRYSNDLNRLGSNCSTFICYIIK